MRIALVHSFYGSAQPSGENVVVQQQLDVLAAAGHEVTLVAKYTDAEAQRRAYPAISALHALNLPGSSPMEQLEAFRPDIVHVHNLFPNWSTPWVARYRDRLVATMHNFRPMCAAAVLWRDGHDCVECLETSPIAALRHRCYRDSAIATLPLAIASRGAARNQPLVQHARRLIVLNRRAEEIYSQVAPGRVRLLPNFSLPATDASGTVAMRTQTDMVGPWLYVGRFTSEKGILELIEAWPSDRNLTIIGAGPLEDQVRVAVAGREEISLLGQVNAIEVLNLMEEAAGLVLPSLWSEGIPTVTLEALSRGLPLVVSRDCVSAPDLTANGAGAIFDPRVPMSLRKALHAIETVPELSRTAALRLYHDRYAPTVWLDAIELVYGEVLRKAGA